MSVAFKEQRSDIEILAGASGSPSFQEASRLTDPRDWRYFVPDVLDTSVYDRVVTVKTEDAKETSRLMGRRMGLHRYFCHAALHAALELRQR